MIQSSLIPVMSHSVPDRLSVRPTVCFGASVRLVWGMGASSVGGAGAVHRPCDVGSTGAHVGSQQAS